MHFKAGWIGALLLMGIATAQADEKQTVDAKLNQLRDTELLEFVRLMGPSTPTINLPTLETLREKVAMEARYARDANAEQWREALRTIHERMRREVGKLDLPTLRELTYGDGESQYGYYRLRPALLLRLIETEVAAIVAEPRTTLAAPTQAPQSAREAFAAFGTLQAKAIEEKPRGIHQDSAAYRKIIDDFLRGRDDKSATQLLRFGWDSWCGTGAMEFENERTTLVFIGLLRERRLMEAVGACLHVGDSPPWLREPGRPFDQWRIDLLKWCGFDWEEELIQAGRYEAALAAAGSERAARHRLARLWSASKKKDIWTYDLDAIASFLIPGSPASWAKDDPRLAISARTQSEIFALFEEAVQQSDQATDQLTDVLDTLDILQREETKGTLRRLLKHPLNKIANRAATILVRLGEPVAPILPASPARFLVSLNGKPWRSARLQCLVVGAQIPFLGDGTLLTDEEGFSTIPRDEFLDPRKRGTYLKIGQIPAQGWGDDRLNSAWVEARIEIPKTFDQTIPIRFTTCPVPIVIDYATSPELGKSVETEIHLAKADASAVDRWGYLVKYGRSQGAPPTNLTLGAITPGRYQIFMATPGATHYVGAPFTVAPGMAPVRVKLEKGSHVYVRLSIPGNARGAGLVALYRNGRDITDEVALQASQDDSQPRFTALPRGRYQLRVFSTAEYMKRNKITDWKSLARYDGNAEQGVDCEGRTVDFTIDDQSPPFLDLGVLEISPVAAMKAQATATQVFGGAPPR